MTVNDVYVAGNNYSRASNAYCPTIWRNGAPQQLGGGGGMAESIFVHENDVYVAGYESNVGKVWKNGVKRNLSSGANPANARSIYVKGGYVYAVGLNYDVWGVPYSMVWRGLTVESAYDTIKATDIDMDAQARSVFVR